MHLSRLKMNSLKTKLEPLFKKEPSIGVVYLYGSYAQGKQSSLSDVDLAIYFTEQNKVKRHDLLFSISSKISGVLNTDKTDVSSLNDLEGIELKYQIISQGHVIFEREPYRILIEPSIMNEYFDFKYLLRKYKLTGT